MAGGSGRVVTGGGIASGKARVENERLWVDAVISSGGGGVSANVTIVGPLPVPVDIVSSISLPINDNGGSITVDGTVSIGGTVTIAEPVSVDDNGGSLTIDGTVAVSSVAGTVTVAGTVAVSSVAGTVTIGDGGGSITVDGTVAVSSIGGTVTIGGTVAVSSVAGTVTVAGTVAVSSVIPGTAATNLGKAEDAGHTTGDVGVMALAVRNDANTALATTTLDYIPLTTDSLGNLWTSAAVTSILPGTGPTNLGKKEDDIHVSGDTGVMALAVRSDTPAATAANGDYVPLLTDSLGRLHIGPGTLASSLGKAEDAVHTSGDVGVMSLAVRQDTLAALAADGDYIPFTVDSLGRLNVSAYVVAEPFTVLPLSSSTNGRPITVNGGGFVTIHTTVNVEVITIYVTNVGVTDRILVLGVGGTATADQIFVFAPASETVVAISEAQIGRVAGAVVIQANLDAAGTCRVFGRVTRRAA
jgi:hypothetical protein